MSLNNAAQPIKPPGVGLGFTNLQYNLVYPLDYIMSMISGGDYLSSAAVLLHRFQT